MIFILFFVFFINTCFASFPGDLEHGKAKQAKLSAQKSVGTPCKAALCCTVSTALVVGLYYAKYVSLIALTQISNKTDFGDPFGSMST